MEVGLELMMLRLEKKKFLRKRSVLSLRALGVIFCFDRCFEDFLLRNREGPPPTLSPSLAFIEQ